MNKGLSATEEYMSDEMLEYFKKKLLKLKEELSKSGEEIESKLKKYSNPHEINDAVMSADARNKKLMEIDEALKRISDGTYGYCEEKDVEIGFKRLDIHPTARYCVEAQEEFDKRRRFLENHNDG